MLHKRSYVLMGILASAMVMATGCSSDTTGSTGDTQGTAGGDTAATTVEGLSGSIAGAGASSQSAAMQAWIATFTQANSGVTINYDPVGSGGGREQFVSGGVQFAGSDAALKEEELAKLPESCGEVIELPAYISPIAIPFNIEGVTELNLTPANLAKIFDGKITKWNDPELVKDNPDANLPDLRINPVHRSDASGTTENFTDYLEEIAKDAWPHEASKDWPSKTGESAQQTSGIIQAVTAGNGSIGYADASQVGQLSTAKVQVGGEFVGYSAEAAAAIVDASPIAEGRGKYDYALQLDREAKGGYPIVLVSYELACSKYDSEEHAKVVANWLKFIVSEQGQTLSAQAAGSAPISAELREKALTAIEAISK